MFRAKILPSDPFSLKGISKCHPRRLVFTGYYRAADFFGRLTFKEISQCIDLRALEHSYPDRGGALADTALTTTKTSLLLDAVSASESLWGPIVEIGSYRGATTCAFAAATQRRVYAVDPFIGYGGSQRDEQIFQNRILQHPNISHLRLTSGEAVARPECQRVSLVFIDAVNDYANFWFNCNVWMQRVQPGGFLAVNQVDEWSGPNLACRRLLRLDDKIAPWGYCQDLIVFRKLS